jgi:cyanophycinase
VGIKVDPDTNSFSEWRKYGDEFESLDFLNDVNGVWFSGGDQIKIIKGFLRSDGADTKLLRRIREILENGGVIGGTSAGAAIMSQVMIGGGTSFGALSMPHYYDYMDYRNKPELEDRGALLIINGLGFFKEGIVDQHFDKRSRQGRLLEAMFDREIMKGYGISEDTALVYDVEKGLISTVGSGGVAVVDISDGKRSKIGDYSKITDVKLSYLRDSDTYDIYKEEYKVNIQNQNREQDYYAYMKYISNILLSVHCDYSEIIGKIIKVDKMDIFYYSEDKKMHYVKDYQPGDEEAEYEIRLYKKDGYTRGFVKEDCSFVNIILDILPVALKAGVSKEAVK